MPFIDCKLSRKLTDGEKEKLKAELGKKISLLRKPESYLMVGIADGYDLYFAGNKLENGAFVAVSLFGKPSPADCEKMTAALCELFGEEFSISGDKIYVTYQGISDWGWNGGNF